MRLVPLALLACLLPACERPQQAIARRNLEASERMKQEADANREKMVEHYRSEGMIKAVSVKDSDSEVEVGSRFDMASDDGRRAVCERLFAYCYGPDGGKPGRVLVLRDPATRAVVGRYSPSTGIKYVDEISILQGLAPGQKK